MNSTFKIIIAIYLAINVPVVFSVPLVQTTKLEEISYEIKRTFKNITEYLDVDPKVLDKAKDYVQNVVDDLKKKGDVTVELLTNLKEKLSKVGKKIKDTAEATAYDAYDDIIEKTSIYLEIAEKELGNFFDDIKPNVNDIQNSIAKMVNTVSDNVGGILDKFMTHTDYLFKSQIKEE